MIMKDIFPALVPVSLMAAVFLYGYFGNPFQLSPASTRKTTRATPQN